MSENWGLVLATGSVVQPKYWKGAKRENFMDPITVPDKSQEESSESTRASLRIVKETSRTGPEREQYSSGNNLNLGVERERQRDGLRNELYAEVLAAQLDRTPEESEWTESLDQILRVVEAIPVTRLKASVYVCDDGEIGIVWRQGNVHIEISAGVSEHVEYMVLDEDEQIREESIWMIESGERMPETLSSALAEGCP